MKPDETSNLYKLLDEKTRDAINYINKVAENIIKQYRIEVIKEIFDTNSDMEDWWYSYVIVMNCKNNITQKLNETYIDNFIEENSLVDIENKIIFRFESGA